MERKARGTNFNFKQQCVCEWSQKEDFFLGRPLWEINITGNNTFRQDPNIFDKVRILAENAFYV